MSYFADLTPHTYAPTDGETVLNVGWLDNAYPYTRGETSPEFQVALQRLCENPVWLHMGFHRCQFCPREDVHTWSSVHLARLGNGQIRVQGADEVWYAAPVMIHHYVKEHQYLPPAPFIETVLRAAVVRREGQ